MHPYGVGERGLLIEGGWGAERCSGKRRASWVEHGGWLRSGNAPKAAVGAFLPCLSWRWGQCGCTLRKRTARVAMRRAGLLCGNGFVFYDWHPPGFAAWPGGRNWSAGESLISNSSSSKDASH